MREYGIRVGDQVQVWGTNDDEGGTDHWLIRTEPWAVNQGQASAPTAGGLITPEHREGLRQAGYGDWANPNLTEADFQRISAGAQSGGGAAGGDWSSLWGALTGSNQQQFDEQKRQFNQNQFSSMAQALLSGAAQLRGPADWLKYAQYTSGGKNIFDILRGDKTVAAFGQPTDYSQPATISTLLQDLGLATAPITGSGQASTYNTINGPRTVQQMRDELVKASGGMDEWRVAPDDRVVSEYGKVTGRPVSAAGVGTGDTNLGLAAGLGGTATTPTAQAQTGQTAGNVAPLPYQINPAVWDSLSDTAKVMILSSAEAGNTPSGAWSADDYLRQLEAARPKGTVPTSLSYNWATQNAF